MSDSEDSMVTYTTVSSPYEGRSGDVSPGEDGPPIMLEDLYAYVVVAFQALPPPDYVPVPEEPEQAPPSPIYIPYVPEPEYLEYIPPEDEVFPAEEQPLPAAASPTADSPGYIPESDPDEDPKDDDDEDLEEDPVDYPTDHDDDDEEEEEPSRDDADGEDEEQDEDDNDEEEEHSASADSIPPLPALPSPPLLPIPLPVASPPLQLLSSDRRADRPEVTLPPQKRLSIVHRPGYEVGESSAAAVARPIEGRRADYGFVGSVEAEIRLRIAEDIGYGIRDTWIDPRDVAKEEALTTLEGVNTRVTELAAVQEQDTQDIYGVMEDAQATLTTQLSSLQGHLVTTLGEIQALQAKEQAHVEESDRVERYIGGLPDLIHGSVAASKPKTMQEATVMATGLMDKKIHTYAESQATNKRKFEDTFQNNQGRQQPPKRQDVTRAYAAGSDNRQQYAGFRPLCPKCNFNHNGLCIPRCYKCNKIGHLARDCRSPTNANVANNQRGNGAGQKATCYECGAQGHFKRNCPKLKNNNNNNNDRGNQVGTGNAQARVYVVGNAETNPNANTVTDHDYAVELADGRIVGVNTIIRSCTLNFLNHPFNIDLMPVEMGSFDVIIGMDWLSRYEAVIVCADKIVRIPWGRETNIISCAKTQKYMLKGCQVFLAHVTTKEAEGKS
nr:hypothetical protein [Tanacetum cinerariifolium]